MRTDGLKLRRLHINDASLLKGAGVFSGKLADIESTIRLIIADNTRYSYIILDESDNFLAFSLFVPMSMCAKIFMLNIFFSQDTDKYYEILETLFYHSFIDKNFHKINLVIDVNDHMIEEAAIKVGMMQNAVLEDEIPLENGNYEDAGLFYITASEFTGYNVGFVAFQRGVVCVYGNNDYVDRLTLYRYGDKPQDAFTVSVARRLGLLDDNGCFLPKNSNEYYDLDNSLLPSELSKAVNELYEYFLKKRDSFDINVKYNVGTEFQINVWNEIRNIPYGSTVSYEEIAQRLTSDKKEARKLTRAVGAALGDNPVPVLVPCHRVIGKDGKLVGYSLGVDMKDFLLQHESIFMTLL